MRETSTGTPRRGLRRWIPFLLVGLAAVGLYFIIWGEPPRTDTEKIQALLVEGEQAVEEKNLSRLMGLVSKDFKTGDLNKDRLRLLVAQGLREYREVYVTLDNVSIQPQGDTATVTATVTLEAHGGEGGGTTNNTTPVTLELKREAGQRFLVIPTDRWRVVRVEGTGLENLGGGLFDF